MLFVRERLTVFPRDGREPATGAHLCQGVRIPGPGVVPPELLWAAHKPDPIAAQSAFDGSVETPVGESVERAIPAPNAPA